MTTPNPPSILSASCPRCDATPGLPCVSTSTNRPAPKPHRVRAVEAVRLQHQPRLSRRTLGGHPVSGRPVYGWSAACSCGWSQKSNEGKSYAESLHRDHIEPFVRALLEATP